MRICCNPECEWVGEEAETMDYKHGIGARLCPECYEVTEEYEDEAGDLKQQVNDLPWPW